MAKPYDKERELLRAIKANIKTLRESGKREEAAGLEEQFLGDGAVPAAPTFAQQVSKAGGRLVRLTPVPTVVDWHELEG